MKWKYVMALSTNDKYCVLKTRGNYFTKDVTAKGKYKGLLCTTLFKPLPLCCKHLRYFVVLQNQLYYNKLWIFASYVNCNHPCRMKIYSVHVYCYVFVCVRETDKERKRKRKQKRKRKKESCIRLKKQKYSYASLYIYIYVYTSIYSCIIITINDIRRYSINVLYRTYILWEKRRY